MFEYLNSKLKMNFTSTLNVLIIEDDKFQSSIYAQVIENFGHSYHVCSSLDEVNEITKIKGFDLIISDLNLNNDSGFDSE